MMSRNLLTGVVVLLAASLVNSGPCRPVSSSTNIASVSETGASSSGSETAIETASTAAIVATSTETGTSVTIEATSASAASSIDTTTTILIDTTSTEAVVTTTTAAGTTTTTAEASTTTEAPEALQSIYLFAFSSVGVRSPEFPDTQVPDTQWFDFTSNTAASTQSFTYNQRTGELKILSGAHAGESALYVSSSATGYSFVIVADAAYGEENGLTRLDCQIVQATSYQELQCKYSDEGNADFWLCDSHLVVVKAGTDFTSMCSHATTSYRIQFIQVIEFF
ncbi:hypothetical protein FBEOM_5630 [Fusarium beomiforme]|uniref:Uncharacterized protein n=1 Tax=Fusarium beomiforme TaxID=44412 RepID=A0A9P5AKJ9_9HYPO|nr:hypothetical protein FBEOM_5630 [Fusarium beomiforme]